MEERERRKKKRERRERLERKEMSDGNVRVGNRNESMVAPLKLPAKFI